jgi:hydrogen peroxide-dependent heme synthase
VSGKSRERAHPPETLEGWYSLHDTYALSPETAERKRVMATLAGVCARMTTDLGGRGWSVLVSLVGGPFDVLAMHFRETPEELHEARWGLAEASDGFLGRASSQLGVTEAGLYHITAELAREARQRGGTVGDVPYLEALSRRAAAERETEHVRRRLYPMLPTDMPYVSFYPMSKRRQRKQNWYELSLQERSALMREHGLTGRKYAGRVLQIITGSIGLSEWEWGVTLFASDLLDVKRLVTDMRFDAVSARYAEFGDFHVGRVKAMEAYS